LKIEKITSAIMLSETLYKTVQQAVILPRLSNYVILRELTY